MKLKKNKKKLKKYSSQPVLSFKTRDHGHEAKIDRIEDKPLKKSKNLKKKKKIE